MGEVTHQNNGLSHCDTSHGPEGPLLTSSKLTFQPQKENLNKVNKNQRWEHIRQKYKANDNTSKHNPKKKQKQTISKN
jgi:hypothetical protein